MSKPNYDTTVARIAGNIAGQLLAINVAHAGTWEAESVAYEAVDIARAIVAEVRRTETDPEAKP